MSGTVGVAPLTVWVGCSFGFLVQTNVQLGNPPGTVAAGSVGSVILVTSFLSFPAVFFFVFVEAIVNKKRARLGPRKGGNHTAEPGGKPSGGEPDNRNIG